MSTATATPAETTPTVGPVERNGPVEGMGSVVTGLLLDVVAPLAGYYAMHLAGAGDWAALLVATAAAGARVLWVAVRARRVTWFGAVMLAVFGIGLALAFVSGDPRFLLLKESVTTGAVGLVFLGSLVVGDRPLALSAFQAWQPRRAAETLEQYRTIPLARRAYRVSSAVWGLGLLAEALVRVPLIYALPIEVTVGLSTAVMVAAITGLTAWNVVYVRRLMARAAG